MLTSIWGMRCEASGLSDMGRSIRSSWDVSL
jgi:hypothetical protein